MILPPGIAQDIRSESPRDGRTSRAARTVEVEHVLETPSHLPPQAGPHCPATDSRLDHFQASQLRAKRQPVHAFEQGNSHRQEKP